MTVRDGYSGCGRDVELEDCNGTSRRLALKQESDRQLPDTDLFASARHPEYSYSVLLSVCLPLRRSYWLRWLVVSALQPLHATEFPRRPLLGMRQLISRGGYLPAGGDVFRRYAVMASSTAAVAGRTDDG